MNLWFNILKINFRNIISSNNTDFYHIIYNSSKKLFLCSNIKETSIIEVWLGFD